MKSSRYKILKDKQFKDLLKFHKSHVSSVFEEQTLKKKLLNTKI